MKSRGEKNYMNLLNYTKKKKIHKIDEIIKLQGHYTLLLLSYICEFGSNELTWEKNSQK